MAKTDPYRNGPALAEYDPADEFLRPAAPAPARPRAQRPVSPRPEDEEGDGEEVFLRARKRVPVRKGLLPAFFTRTAAGRVVLGSAALAVIAILVLTVLAVKSFLDHDPRFLIDSAAAIEIDGSKELTRADLLTVFGSDIGRNLFFVPLAQRRRELEQVPWVAHATVMRILPNQLRVSIVERTPIAFVREGNQIKLADADGVILEMQPAALAARHYSFPVVTGIHPEDPLSVRRPRMQLYQKFMSEIDSTGEKLSKSLSEIDLSDPEDVQGLVSSEGSEILLHFGQDNFLDRWHEYQAHLAEWKQQYPRLASVDLRYDRQVVLKMSDAPATPAAPTDAVPASASAPKRPAAKAQAAVHPRRKHA